jgi:hypothetical protein
MTQRRARLVAPRGAAARTLGPSSATDITIPEVLLMAIMARTRTANSRTRVSHSPLARAAGPLALMAGVLIVVPQLVLFLIVDRSQMLATLASPLYGPSAVAYFAGFCGLLVALVAVYHREARGVGTFGAIGFVAALVGTMFLAGDQWYEAFAAPWFVAVAPEVVTGEASGLFQIGALASYGLFSAGWVLFGLAHLRARVIPRTISAAIIISGIIGFLALLPPYGVPLGLTMAWLGVWMLRTNNPVETIAQREESDRDVMVC